MARDKPSKKRASEVDPTHHSRKRRKKESASTEGSTSTPPPTEALLAPQARHATPSSSPADVPQSDNAVAANDTAPGPDPASTEQYVFERENNAFASIIRDTLGQTKAESTVLCFAGTAALASKALREQFQEFSTACARSKGRKPLLQLCQGMCAKGLQRLEILDAQLANLSTAAAAGFVNALASIEDTQFASASTQTEASATEAQSADSSSKRKKKNKQKSNSKPESKSKSKSQSQENGDENKQQEQQDDRRESRKNRHSAAFAVAPAEDQDEKEARVQSVARAEREHSGHPREERSPSELKKAKKSKKKAKDTLATPSTADKPDHNAQQPACANHRQRTPRPDESSQRANSTHKERTPQVEASRPSTSSVIQNQSQNSNKQIGKSKGSPEALVAEARSNQHPLDSQSAEVSSNQLSTENRAANDPSSPNLASQAMSQVNEAPLATPKPPVKIKQERYISGLRVTYPPPGPPAVLKPLGKSLIDSVSISPVSGVSSMDYLSHRSGRLSPLTQAANAVIDLTQSSPEPEAVRDAAPDAVADARSSPSSSHSSTSSDNVFKIPPHTNRRHSDLPTLGRQREVSRAHLRPSQTASTARSPASVRFTSMRGDAKVSTSRQSTIDQSPRGILKTSSSIPHQSPSRTNAWTITNAPNHEQTLPRLPWYPHSSELVASGPVMRSRTVGPHARIMKTFDHVRSEIESAFSSLHNRNPSHLIFRKDPKKDRLVTSELRMHAPLSVWYERATDIARRVEKSMGPWMPEGSCWLAESNELYIASTLDQAAFSLPIVRLLAFLAMPTRRTWQELISDQVDPENCKTIFLGMLCRPSEAKSKRDQRLQCLNGLHHACYLTSEESSRQYECLMQQRPCMGHGLEDHDCLQQFPTLGWPMPCLNGFRPDIRYCPHFPRCYLDADSSARTSAS